MRPGSTTSACFALDPPVDDAHRVAGDRQALLGAEAPVEGHGRRAEQQAGVQDDAERFAGGQREPHAIARAHAPRGQPARRRAGLALELGVGQSR